MDKTSVSFQFSRAFFCLFSAFLFSAQTHANSESLVSTKTRLKETNIYRLGECSKNKSKVNCLIPVKLSKALPEGTGVQVDTAKILSLTSVRYIYENKELKKQSFPAIGLIKVESLPECSESNPSEKDLENLEGKELFVQMESIDSSEVIAKEFPGSVFDISAKLDFAFRWDKHNPSGSWSRFIYDALEETPTKLAEKTDISDIREFCPYYNNKNFDRHSKKLFWIGLFNEIAYRESLFIPYVQNDEGQYSQRNTGVVSRGLMQMSFDSLRSEIYRDHGCDIKKADDLHEPLPNLKCGLAIFSALIERDGCIACTRRGNAKGPSLYWSTLRAPYQIECDRCGSQGLTLGKKAGIIKSLKNRVPFCFPPMSEDEKKAALASMAAPSCPIQQ